HAKRRGRVSLYGRLYRAADPLALLLAPPRSHPAGWGHRIRVTSSRGTMDVVTGDRASSSQRSSGSPPRPRTHFIPAVGAAQRPVRIRHDRVEDLAMVGGGAGK